jgi:hypothetical protein
MRFMNCSSSVEFCLDGRISSGFSGSGGLYIFMSSCPFLGLAAGGWRLRDTQPSSHAKRVRECVCNHVLVCLSHHDQATSQGIKKEKKTGRHNARHVHICLQI